MTEVASPLPPPTIGGPVLSVRKYEAGPPASVVAELKADPENALASTKEEEWVTKKKTELTTTRQIETRVKRQVVLEDGKVVEDSGPIVTTNTTEDTEKQEHNQTEHRKTGDDDGPERDWLPVAGPGGLVKEVKERVVKSREETEERLETEDVQHIGDISDEGYMRAVASGKTGKLALDTVSRDVVDTGPRIIHQSTKNRKIIDTEDKQESQERQADGKMVTETRRTVQREEINDANLPDEGQSEGESINEESRKESAHHYRRTKDQDLTEYLVNGVKIGQKLRYQVESADGERFGDPNELDKLESLSARIRRMRVRSQHKLAIDNLERKDALTKRPLDFDQEEETRKNETSKWLENHFGSESSKESLDDLAESPPATQTSFINVTMKSRPVRGKSPNVLSSDDEKLKKLAPREILLSSPECESPINGYFRGVTDWSSRQRDDKRGASPPVLTPPPPESPPFIITSHRMNSLKSARFEERDRTESTPVRSRVEMPSPPARRSRTTNGYRSVDYDFRSLDRRQKRVEPRPDYTPPSESPSPVDDTLLNHHTNKKLYQRTRFAADIPPPPQPQPPPQQASIPRPAPVKSKSKIGESFRKFVGKLRSSDKKKTSRSPSPRDNSYSAFHSVDNNIPYAARGVGPVAPPRTRPVQSATPGRTYDMDRRHVQKYYLGEDPYAGSIYGREREYDGVSPFKSNKRSHSRNNEDYHSSTLGRFSKSTSRLGNSENRYDYERGGVQTLPRKLKSEQSTKRPVEAQRSLGETKTLSPTHWERQQPSKLSNSMINVSFVSHPPKGLLNGPAKPARTYKANLLRSKSFNVQAGNEYRDNFKSNPQLHRLDEHPQPLKSPGIISELNRSSRDITDDGFNFHGRNAEDKRRAFMSGLMSRAPELYKSLHGDEPPQNGKRFVNYSNSFRSTSTNDSPLRSPGYFNERISPNFREISHDGNTTRSIIRRGSDDDYSEIVRITSKSDDPLRPSETNTVKTFSKKIVPTKNGRSKETIESEETKTVMKSRYVGGDADRSKSPHGVVIEVRSPASKLVK